MEEKQVGVITHYFSKIAVGIIELCEPLKVGDRIHIRGAHDDFTESIDSMQIEHKTVQEANPGESVGVKVAQKVHPHDKVFKIIE